MRRASSLFRPTKVVNKAVVSMRVCEPLRFIDGFLKSQTHAPAGYGSTVLQRVRSVVGSGLSLTGRYVPIAAVDATQKPPQAFCQHTKTRTEWQRPKAGIPGVETAWSTSSATYAQKFEAATFDCVSRPHNLYFHRQPIERWYHLLAA